MNETEARSTLQHIIHTDDGIGTSSVVYLKELIADLARVLLWLVDVVVRRSQ